MTVTVPMQVQRSFPSSDRSVALARRWVRETLQSWGADAVLHEAVLLTSELVTNAVMHAGTDVGVSCVQLDGSIRLEVADRYPSRNLPLMPAPPDPDREGGRGLFLSSAIAAAWGVEYTRTVKRVWVRLDLPDVDGRSVAAAVQPPVTAADPSPVSGPAAASMVTTSVGGAVLSWDAGASALTGWSPSEAARLTLGELVVLDADGQARFTVDDVMAQPRWQGGAYLRHRDGHLVPAFASYARDEIRAGGSGSWLLVPAEQRALLEAPSQQRAMTPIAAGTASQELAGLDVGGARLPLDDLLQRTIEYARDALDGDAALAVLATDVDGEAQVRAVSGLAPARLGDVVPLDLNMRRVAGADRPAQLGEEAPPRPGPPLDSPAVRSSVSAPLLVDGRVFGTVAVAAADDDHFGSDDAQRLRQIADRVALAVEGARLTELERQRRGWLAFLAEASDLLAGTLDRDMAMAIVAQLVVPRLATWCAVHLVNGTGDSSRDPRRVRDERAEEVEPWTQLGHVWHADEACIDWLRAILTLAEPPLTRIAPNAEDWDLATALRGRQPPEGTAQLLNDVVVTIPLLARGRALGSLVLGRGSEGFRREALDLAEDLARRAALALDNARLYSDIAAAGQALQRSLLPPELPVVPGLEVGVAYQAAGEGNEVGGDFYDLFGSSDGWWGFAVGDVCGKGAPAAAVTGLARHTLRALTRAGRPVAEALVRLNAALLDEGPDNRFVTVLFGIAQPQASGGALLSFVSAGHPLPLVLRANGTVETAGSPQPLVGVMPDLDFVEDTVRLEPGDVLLAVTDGVTERRDGDRWLGEDGLAEILRGCHGLAASAVAARVQQVVRDFAPDPPRDDMAVLVLQAH